VAWELNPSIVVGCNTPSGMYEKASGAFGESKHQFIEGSCIFQPQHCTYLS